MVTNNNNNSNVILSTDRQGVSNRYMVGYNCSTEKLLQHGFKSRKTISVGIKKCSPTDNKITLVKKYSIQNSISFKTFSVKIPSQPIVSGETGGNRNGQEGAIRKV